MTTPVDAAIGWTAILFDLDGTILDSSPIICRAMSLASAEFGHPHDPAVFRPFIGPPPWHTFAEVTGEPPHVVERIVPRYREIYDGLMGDTPVYPGLPSLIEALAGTGIPLAVATSKLRAAAIALLEGAGLAGHFVAIQGAGSDAASAAKATVIGTAIADLEAAGVDTSRMVMIGDRHHDIDGAAEFGVPTILVAWGYGTPGEEDGAIAVARTPVELLGLLGLTPPVMANDRDCTRLISTPGASGRTAEDR